MTLLSNIAREARLGNVGAINKLLDEAPSRGEEIVWGRAQADRILKRDPPLPQLSADPLSSIDGWVYRPGVKYGHAA